MSETLFFNSKDYASSRTHLFTCLFTYLSQSIFKWKQGGGARVWAIVQIHVFS